MSSWLQRKVFILLSKTRKCVQPNCEQYSGKGKSRSLSNTTGTFQTMLCNWGELISLCCLKYESLNFISG